MLLCAGGKFAKGSSLKKKEKMEAEYAECSSL
jgi:hypothetical protein